MKNLAIFFLLVLVKGTKAQGGSYLAAAAAPSKRRNHNVFLQRKSAKSDGSTPTPAPFDGVIFDDAAAVNADARKKSRGEGHRKSSRSRGKGRKGMMKRKSSKSSWSSSHSKSPKGSKDHRMDNDDYIDDGPPNDSTLSPTVLTTQAPVASRPTPTASPVATGPTTTESPTISIQQATPSAVTRCVPTVGPCIDNIDDLTSTLINLNAGNTVALCQGTINTTKAVNIDTSNTVLCCEENATDACTLQATGSHRTLEVEAGSFTTLGVTYRGGRSNENGGNVFISGPGSHQLTNSIFLDGASNATGGNAYVETDGGVLVLGSSFEGGVAAREGGGLAINGASTVGVILSTFDNNEAPEGAGMYATRGDINAVGQQMLMEDTVFSNNVGSVGVGLMVSELGAMPSLGILNTQFLRNTAGPGTTSVGAVSGGVGASAMIFEPVSILNLVLEGNSGASNVATGLNNFCAGIVILQDETPQSAQCLQPGAQFPV